MIVSAPGKLVVSGAYAVLRGAPAIVTAVDRRVVVDTARQAHFQTPEVAAGLALLEMPAGLHPWFDASALREGDRKLGLGSSAAICAASLCGLWLENQGEVAPPLAAEVAHIIYPIALTAHRSAQGGGSGIDVAAACFGGTLEARLQGSTRDSSLELKELSLPPQLIFETWATGDSAKTSEFVKKVLALETSVPLAFARAMKDQEQASVQAVGAAQRGDSDAFVAALSRQVAALSQLGQLAEVPVVLPEVLELHEMLHPQACFMPSGAGGGDVTLYVGRGPSPEPFRQRARKRGFALVNLSLDAPGLLLETG
jgi:phosphomevalonate kinase